jgi:hypothetical protein
MADLIKSRVTGRKTDLLLPCDLASGTLVQFALQPELKSIYSELLSPEGKEVRPPPFTPPPPPPPSPPSSSPSLSPFPPPQSPFDSDPLPAPRRA